MRLKRLQLGLIHVSIALTALPIESTLNRVMIKELAISATLVAILVSLPYVFAPLQIFIGTFTDKHPIFGLHRTPYTALGLFLAILGLSISPFAVLMYPTNPAGGLFLAFVAFSAWGTGYNLATVSYFSLAAELSGPEGRSLTISVMYVMMIISVIVMAIVLGGLVDPYTPEALLHGVGLISLVALICGGLGLIKLESRDSQANSASAPDRASYTLGETLGILTTSKQTLLFFAYLVLLLTAVLGQDVLLEPFAGEAFAMSVRESTRLTALYGVAFLITLVVGGLLDGRLSKRNIAVIGAWMGIFAFAVIIVSGMTLSRSIFYGGVILLGLAIGFSTVSNHALMLDMTTPENVGLFIGAWGLATAFARLAGAMLSGVVRDVMTALLDSPVNAYLSVFALNIIILIGSLFLLRAVNIRRFQSQSHAAVEQIIT